MLSSRKKFKTSNSEVETMELTQETPDTSLGYALALSLHYELYPDDFWKTIKTKMSTLSETDIGVLISRGIAHRGLEEFEEALACFFQAESILSADQNARYKNEIESLLKTTQKELKEFTERKSIDSAKKLEQQEEAEEKKSVDPKKEEPFKKLNNFFSPVTAPTVPYVTEEEYSKILRINRKR